MESNSRLIGQEYFAKKIIIVVKSFKNNIFAIFFDKQLKTVLFKTRDHAMLSETGSKKHSTHVLIPSDSAAKLYFRAI